MEEQGWKNAAVLTNPDLTNRDLTITIPNMNERRTRFIGRRKELMFLEERYLSNRSQLLVVYGRRRIGKTETIKEFCKGKKAAFYTCTQTDDNKQLENFSRTIFSSGFSAGEYASWFSDWNKAFLSAKDLPRNENGKRILVVDEFPYMVKENPEIASILQKEWDSTLKDENVMVILCGSSMSFMEKEVLSEKNPLYGRATGIYKMDEMPFFDAVKFMDGYKPDEKVVSYGLLGGVPYYLEQFEPQKNLKKNIEDSILRKGSVLYSEPEFLIRQELREPYTYNSIIQSIASGKTKFNEIQQDTLLEKGKLSVYLKNLIELGFIARELPVLEPKASRPNFQRGLYKLKSSFFRFWYAYVFPNLSLLEFGDYETVYSKLIEPHLSQFTAQSFEDICIEYLKCRNMEGTLPFLFTQIGRWWNGETEIDAIASDGHMHSLISAECKYHGTKCNTQDIKKHMGKDVRKLLNAEDADVYFYFFSWSGFTDEALEFGKENGVELIAGDGILDFLQSQN